MSDKQTPSSHPQNTNEKDSNNDKSDCPQKLNKIFIDAGHGGKDLGAIGNGIKEHEKNLEIALMLGQMLKAKGYQIMYSRTTSVFVELKDRAKKANEWEADLFLSVHCNSFTDPQANGTETFHHRKASPISQKYAALVNDALTTQMTLKNRGIKTANFAVLRESSMPAILIENAFVSNLADADKLKTNPKGFAEAIASVF